MDDGKRSSYFSYGLALGWTLVVALSLAWNLTGIERQTRALALANAETAVTKDILYRQWVASKGGVYAAVDRGTPPNPYLLDQVSEPEPNLVTPRGTPLTLVNPAYMTRQVHELGRRQGLLDGHLTSLDPIRPENAPATWEREALLDFEAGATAYSALVVENGVALFRYMRPLRVEAACLECHRHQGYRVGDVRGGLSVTLPMTAINVEKATLTRQVSAAHVGLWLFGLTFIGWGGQRLSRRESGLRTANAHLAGEVEGRQQALVRLQWERDEQARLAEQLKQAQSQVVENERLAVIGQLAAGVAHEINNPTGYVLSNCQTLGHYFAALEEYLAACEAEQAALDPEAKGRLRALRERLDIDYLRDDLGNLIDESKEGMTRIKKIVADLKDFSRGAPQENRFAYADLHRGLESTLNLVWNELKYKCELVRDYGRLPEVRCDLARLNQVFMNLLINAAQAIEGKGRISLSSGQEADWVWIRICDDGCGMAPETLKRLFDPFFTTKPVGKGTGLGLSIARSIVEQHGGRIRVQSEQGVGSCFEIRLPIKGPAEPDAQVAPAAAATDPYVT